MAKISDCNYYDDPEFDYQDYWISRDYEDQAERQVLKDFYHVIGPQKWLLDLGGGYGRLADMYCSRVDQAILLEPSTKNINQAKAQEKRYGNLYLVQSTAENPGTKKESMDIVQMIRVAHHCVNLPQIFNNVYQILKNPGWFVFEFPNKIHGLMTLRYLLKGDWDFRRDLSSIDRRCHNNRTDEVIPFMNHHPVQVLKWLDQTGFKIIKCYSVSNWRRINVLPTDLMLKLDKMAWNLSKNVWWGPSIFILAKKG